MSTGSDKWIFPDIIEDEEEFRLRVKKLEAKASRAEGQP
jgi:hypothetical protein